MSAFFSGSETAYFSLSRFDLQRMKARNLRGNTGAISLLKRPSRLLIAILIGNMLVNISATTLTTSTLLVVFPGAAEPIAIVLMTILILIFGEITPKVLAVEHNDEWARFGSRILSGVLFITTPFRVVLQAIQNIFLKNEGREDIRLNEVDLESAFELAHREGAIEEQSRDVLAHFLALEKVTARDIMIPQVKIRRIPAQSDVREAYRLIASDSTDYAFVGEPTEKGLTILEKDTLVFSDDRKTIPELADEPLFVHENRNLAGLFQDLYGDRHRHLVVVDESGDVTGVVSRDDILSAIFAAPFIRSQPEFSRLSRVGNFYLISGEMEIDDFNALFGSDFGSDIQRTIGGFLVEKIGRLPVAGEDFEYNDIVFRVIRVFEGRIERFAAKRVE